MTHKLGSKPGFESSVETTQRTQYSTHFALLTKIQDAQVYGRIETACRDDLVHVGARLS